MWIKSCKDLASYIPEDGKYHDIQIINQNIYIDGKQECVPISEIEIDNQKIHSTKKSE